MAVDPKVAECLPYRLVSVPYGDSGAKRTVARYNCACGADADVPVRSGHGISTDEHRKVLAARGYKVNSRGVVTGCPTCSQPKPKGEPPMAAKPVTTAPLTLVPLPQSSPTHEQRLKIRSSLDVNFDDELGMYRDGMSDQAIAAKLEVPRVWVETIREAAYGPIRVTPEMVALRADITAAQEMLDGLRARLDELEKAIPR